MATSAALRRPVGRTARFSARFSAHRRARSSARRSARLVTVVAAAALGLSLAPAAYAAPGGTAPAPSTTAPAAAAAEPTTAAQAQDEVVKLNDQLEIVTEQFNEAKILRDQRRAEAAVASAQLVQVQRDIAKLDAQVRDVAHGAYTGDPIAGFTVLMTSGSPQEFLDRLNTLDAISAHSNDLAVTLSKARAQAAELTQRSEQALAEADAAAADLQTKQTRIETDLPKLQALLATLTEQERKAALARAHEAAQAAQAAQASQPSTSSSTSAGGSSQRSTSAPSQARSQGRSQDAPPPPSSPIVAPTAAAQIAVDTAYAQLGDPYVWAAAGPDSFDCSGLTMYSYAAAGINLPHSSTMQSTMGVYVPRDQLLPGDLVFFYNPIHHVGIYIGNGQMIHAPNTGSVVNIAEHRCRRLGLQPRPAGRAALTDALSGSRRGTAQP